MSDVAIRVENLSKRYRIGLQEQVHDTMAGALLDFLKRPGTNLRRLRQLTRFSNNGHGSEDVIWALKDVSFEIRQGEVVGVIGRNGAGKSTLLKILSRITHPTGGRVELNGRVSSLLEVGTGFHPELTGRENIYLNGTILGMRKVEIDRKFDEIVAFSGVEKFIDTPVKRYSSGMRVRLAFSVAAHLEPEILLVDEVLAVGDAGFQKKCLGKMGDIAEKGRTVLFVSHHMTAVQNLCQRGIWLEEGRLAQDTSVARAISAYLNVITSRPDRDISEITNRRGVGNVRFRAVEFLNDKGHRVNVVESGARLSIRLHYDAPIGQTFRNAKFSIAFEKNGAVYFIASTDVVQTDELQISGKGWVDCKLKRIPLAAGNYHLTLYCTAGGEVQDWIECAVAFTVGGGDFFGTGRVAPTGYEGKYVLVEHEWSALIADDNYHSA